MKGSNYSKKRVSNNKQIERALASISVKQNLSISERENDRARDYNNFIDNDNYSPTLQKFEREANIKKRNVTSSNYLQWLQDNEKRYGNSSFYHMQWTSNNLGDEHKKIFDFINSEIDENINVESNDEKNVLKTLQTNYTDAQLKKLYKLLIEGNYISGTKENDFIYFFSGKPLKGIKKIKWKKSKSKAAYLLEKICLNLKLLTANHCIETNQKGLRSNNKKGAYNDIEVIIKSIL